MNTSLRSHGKWGDFLVALIPLSWCGNILVNSNFILRMIEWQNESSLFTIKIQGKQWYWTYKYNSDTDFKLRNVYLNVGHDNWWKPSYSSTDHFFKINTNLIDIFEHDFRKIYVEILDGKEKDKNYFANLNYTSATLMNHYNDASALFNNNFYDILKNETSYSIKNTKLTNLPTSLNLFYNTELPTINLTRLVDLSEKTESEWKPGFIKFSSKDVSFDLRNTDIFQILLKKNLTTSFFDSDNLDNLEETAENARFQQASFPVKLLKGTLNQHNLLLLQKNNILNKNIFFNYQLNDQESTSKISQVEQFWGFRQKKNKRLREIKFNNLYDPKTYKHIGFYLNDEIKLQYNLYNSIKNNKYKHEMIPVSLAKRLLRTKRTLVLPAHVNLTLITGSYDVVHSWFVPGLGLKLDCVPGRSTHHSLYIDNIGFYYGQCAEICGRYHHHMPIRICALPYHQFMIWWNHKGFPRMYRSELYKSNKNLLLQKLN